LRGEMYALEAYGEMMLAELYCSGVPLSTLDFQGDFTYKPSSSQTEVYAHALALFDSALAISSDSASVMALASTGKGRVLLDLDSATAAAQAVASVATGFQYGVPIAWGSIGNGYPFASANPTNPPDLVWNVATSEGGNGLPFGTANDPRVSVTSA